MTLALSLAQIASIETKATTTTAKCVYILINKSAQNFSIEKCLFHASI